MAHGAGPGAPYVAGATWCGLNLTTPTLSHAALVAQGGGTLECWMSADARSAAWVDPAARFEAD